MLKGMERRRLCAVDIQKTSKAILDAIFEGQLKGGIILYPDSDGIKQQTWMKFNFMDVLWDTTKYSQPNTADSENTSRLVKSTGGPPLQHAPSYNLTPYSRQISHVNSTSPDTGCWRITSFYLSSHLIRHNLSRQQRRSRCRIKERVCVGVDPSPPISVIEEDWSVGVIWGHT